MIRLRDWRSGVMHRGTSLLELLVVISILSFLGSLLLPAVIHSRSASRRVQCANNLRQLSLAASNFHAYRNEFPAGLEQSEWRTPPRFRGTSLFCFLLPYLEENNVVRDWDYESPLANAAGGRSSRTAALIPTLLCPADFVSSEPVKVGDNYFGLTSYGGNGGTRSVDPLLATTDGLFHTTGPASEPTRDQRPTKHSEITDGTSKTFLLGERRHTDTLYESFAEASWTESLRYLGRWAAVGGRRRIADVTMSAYGGLNYQLPFDYETRQNAVPPLPTSRDFSIYEDRRVSSYGSEHPSGSNFAYVDGSVHFHVDCIEPTMLTALCTRAAEELVDER